MPNRLYEEMTAGENLVAKDVVYLSADNTVKKVTGSLQTIFGVCDETISNTNSGRIALFGRATVVSSGTVTAGDLVIGAATGKVATFAPITSKLSSNHAHGIPDNGVQSDSETDSSTITIPSIVGGEFAGGKILGLAFTTATNNDVDILLSVHG